MPNNISVVPGTDVYYCYEVTNTGNVTMTLHDLVDTQLGTILDDFPLALAPGASVSLTDTATVTETTTNAAVWTAFNPGPTDVALATATATVNVAKTTSKTVTASSGPTQIPNCGPR